MTFPRQGTPPDASRQQALSSFLQEKLQRERKAESDRMAASAADCGRAFLNSSVQDGSRPRSSASPEPRKKGLGVKEMEQVISNLHKQNFDLKLELYHRRERQTFLEERVEALESDKKQIEEVNDTLVEELEKRDKAVEEAVAMIIMLEAKVGQLVQEGAMVRGVETQHLDRPRDCQEACPDHASDHASREPDHDHDHVTPQNRAKVITRMPSFISEPTESTENLRIVYLGVKGSAPSLARVAEAPSEADLQMPSSPTLSVLSESSFMSVYGTRDNDEAGGLAPPAHIDEPFLLDGLAVSYSNPRPQSSMTPRRRAASVSKAVGSVKPPPRSSTAVPFHSSYGASGYGSPLQRLERLDATYSSKRDASRSQGQGRNPDSQPAPTKAPSCKQAKEEKREALRRVTTDASGGVRLHDQVLPPTPDTISTTMLHQFKNSNETLLPLPEAANEEASHGASLLPAGYDARASEPASGAPLRRHSSAHGTTGRPRRVSESSCSDHRHQQCTQRSRLADRSTASRREDNGWEGDVDESDDLQSLESSVDIWLRESGKPAAADADADTDAGLAPSVLFAFPPGATRGGWAMNKMFASRDAQAATVGGNQGGNGSAQDVFSMQGHLFSASSGPPPPDRRSSLHARTGSGTTASLGPSSSKNSLIRDAWKSSPRSRPRHDRDSSEDLGSVGEAQAPVQQQPLQPAPSHAGGDQKRYPPLSNQQGARAGFNRLFRRSIGGGSSSNAPPSDTASSPNSTAESSFSDSNSKGGHLSVGVPSWVLRNYPIDEDRSGATPPPIMMNPRQSRRNTLESIPDREAPFSPKTSSDRGTAVATQPQACGGGGQAQAAPQRQEDGAAPATGGRRKWLPTFGRASGVKSKAG